MQLPIYLDYMATTPVDPRVIEKMHGCLAENFGNAASRANRYGYAAEEAVWQARQEVAALVQADPAEIIWTSGATEANNLAIKGAAQFYQRKGKHIITCVTEHKAVLDSCRQLERSGFTITYLPVQENGLLDLSLLAANIRPDTILISIMHVNNEIGVIQDIAAIGELTRGRGILLHVDAVQSAGKIPIDLRHWKVDLMSFSAHKLYGPKGIGALFVRQNPRVHLEPLIHGGGHERGLRSGTLPTHQIVGMGTAFALANEQFAADNTRIEKLRNRLWQAIKAIDGLYLNGDPKNRIVHNLNISIAGIDSRKLLAAFPDLAMSSGSACNSANIEPSYVLCALGQSDELALSSLRISLGRFTTEEEIDIAINAIKQGITQLRAEKNLKINGDKR